MYLLKCMSVLSIYNKKLLKLARSNFPLLIHLKYHKFVWEVKVKLYTCQDSNRDEVKPITATYENLLLWQHFDILDKQDNLGLGYKFLKYLLYHFVNLYVSQLMVRHSNLYTYLHESLSGVFCSLRIYFLKRPIIRV